MWRALASRLRRPGRRTRWVVGCLLALLAAAALEERARTLSFSYDARGPVDPGDTSALAAAATELLDRAHAASGFRGCLRVLHGDDVVVSRCESGDGAPLTERSRFSIGSLWKQHLGLALQERVMSGRLRLDDRVERWLPELATAPCAHVTLEQLVHMTSGLPFVISLATNLRTQLSDEQRTDEDYLREVKSTSLSFEPGTRYQYSNVSFGLLALVLGRADGKPWRSVLAEQYARASMVDTGFMVGAPIDPPVVPGTFPVRCGVVLGGTCFVGLPRWNYSMLPGGGEFSTIDDILLGVRAIAQLRTSDPALYAAFTETTPQSEGYASGWTSNTRTLPDGTAIRWFDHPAEDPGYFADFWFVPDLELTGVLLSSTDFTLDHARYTLLDDVTALLTGRPYEVMRP